MEHKDYLAYKEYVPYTFDKYYRKKENLFEAFGYTFVQYEAEIDYGTFTSDKVCNLLLMNCLLGKATTIHENKKKNTLEDIQAVLDNPEKLELEEEDKADLIALALKLKPIVENIQTHRDDDRA